MAELLTEVARAQARPRRLVAGAALGLGFAALIGFMGAGQIESTRAEAACQAAATALHHAWNPATRAQLAAAFTAASPELGPIAATRTSAWIDQLAAAWSAHRRDLCRETTIDRTRAPELAVRILACLEERQLDLEVTLELLAAADPEVVQHAAHLVSGLAPADTCFTETKWSRAAIGPEDPLQRARGVALRRRLIRASALEDAGKFTAGLTAAYDVLHAATLEGRSELRAAAQMRVGNLHDRRGAYAEAEQALEQAVWLAAQDGHDETVAEAASMLAFTVGLHRGRHDDALRWARLSQAALHRAGAETSLRAARLHSVLGTLHRLRGDLDLAHEHAEQALALREALLGQEHPDVARALNTLGNVDVARGELDLALAHHTRALAIRERVYGHENFDVATSLRNLGDTRRVRGELPLALAHHTEALRLRERLLGADHPGVAEARVDLGRTQQALGDLTAANLSFGRAIDTYEHINATPQTLADALLHAGEVALALGHAPEALARLERARALAGAGEPPFPARAAILTALAQAREACEPATTAAAAAR
jgi:tetratricopeptide (TPR) repeat protein